MIGEGLTLLVDKPISWTSFDVVNKLRYTFRKTLNIKKIKVGHAGTLDPLATGLLIICVGKHTKKIGQFMGLEKEYEGQFAIGATTPSYDLETSIDQHFPIEHVQKELIQETAKRFVGAIRQLPPIFSAIKVDGVRAYKKARAGESIEMKSREVFIRRFDVQFEAPDTVHFLVCCSKGTYIRSLAHDFGKAINSGAHLKLLKRTKIGTFSVTNAWNLDELIKAIQNKELGDEVESGKIV